MAAKRHHYVPQFYQKFFADDDGLLWRYDRKLLAYKTLAPKVICFEENLYSIRPEGLPLDQRIETDILAPIDGKASSIIKKLLRKERLTDDEFPELCFFIALQFTRLPSFGRAVKLLVETSMNLMVQMQFADVDRAQHSLDRLDRNPHPNVTAQSMVDAVKSGQLNIQATERMFLTHMFQNAETLANLIGNAGWTMLCAPKQTGFIFCDHPVTTVFPSSYTEEGGGFATPGSITLFPLSREVCLQLDPYGQGWNYHTVGPTAVRTVNLNVMANSERFVMGRSREQLESLLARSGCQEMIGDQRTSVDVIDGGQDVKFIKFAHLRRKNFY